MHAVPELEKNASLVPMWSLVAPSSDLLRTSPWVSFMMLRGVGESHGIDTPPLESRTAIVFLLVILDAEINVLCTSVT